MGCGSSTPRTTSLYVPGTGTSGATGSVAEVPGHIPTKKDSGSVFFLWSLRRQQPRGEGLSKSETSEATAVAAGTGGGLFDTKRSDGCEGGGFEEVVVVDVVALRVAGRLDALKKSGILTGANEEDLLELARGQSPFPMLLDSPRIANNHELDETETGAMLLLGGTRVGLMPVNFFLPGKELSNSNLQMTNNTTTTSVSLATRDAAVALGMSWPLAEFNDPPARLRFVPSDDRAHRVAWAQIESVAQSSPRFREFLQGPAALRAQTRAALLGVFGNLVHSSVELSLVRAMFDWVVLTPGDRLDTASCLYLLVDPDVRVELRQRRPSSVPTNASTTAPSTPVLNSSGLERTVSTTTNTENVVTCELGSGDWLGERAFCTSVQSSSSGTFQSRKSFRSTLDAPTAAAFAAALAASLASTHGGGNNNGSVSSQPQAASQTPPATFVNTTDSRLVVTKPGVALALSRKAWSSLLSSGVCSEVTADAFANLSRSRTADRVRQDVPMWSGLWDESIEVLMEACSTTSLLVGEEVFVGEEGCFYVAVGGDALVSGVVHRNGLVTGAAIEDHAPEMGATDNVLIKSGTPFGIRGVLSMLPWMPSASDRRLTSSASGLTLEAEGNVPQNVFGVRSTKLEGSCAVWKFPAQLVATVLSMQLEAASELELRALGHHARLDAVLNHPIGRRHLTSFLKIHHAEESLAFWMDVKEFKRKCQQQQQQPSSVVETTTTRVASSPPAAMTMMMTTTPRPSPPWIAQTASPTIAKRPSSPLLLSPPTAPSSPMVITRRGEIDVDDEDESYVGVGVGHAGSISSSTSSSPQRPVLTTASSSTNTANNNNSANNGDFDRLTEARRIITHYVKQGSFQQVNLKSETRVSLQDVLDCSEESIIPENLFDQSVREIEKLMNDDSFPRFRRSDSFERMMTDIRARAIPNNRRLSALAEDSSHFSQGDDPTSSPPPSATTNGRRPLIYSPRFMSRKSFGSVDVSMTTATSLSQPFASTRGHAQQEDADPSITSPIRRRSGVLPEILASQLLVSVNGMGGSRLRRGSKSSDPERPRQKGDSAFSLRKLSGSSLNQQQQQQPPQQQQQHPSEVDSAIPGGRYFGHLNEQKLKQEPNPTTTTTTTAATTTTSLLFGGKRRRSVSEYMESTSLS